MANEVAERRDAARVFTAFLNELLARDKRFMQAVVFTQHDCNKAIAEHPTVQVRATALGGNACTTLEGAPLNERFYTGSMLGVLNGFFATLSPIGALEYCIVAEFKGEEIERFRYVQINKAPTATAQEVTPHVD